ncbi:MAB_1171c family putative transporter [Streptomyces rubiginosohelvolus]|uniref:MAB_1171c family putative transporter n=1 Tax=Streptomyces rubiginosohelvolus TaxID=67362 RepID=UPI0035D9AE82
MPTDDLIDLLTTIPLWVVVAFRAYHWPTTPGKRALLATFATLAVGSTLRLSFIEHALVDLTGWHDFAVLPKHLAVMFSCTLLVGWVESIVPPRETEPAWRRWADFKVRMTAVTLMGIGATVAFPYAAPSITAADGSTDFATPQYGNIAGSVHLALYLLAMAAALFPSALLFLSVARRTDDRLLRLCMRVMAVGGIAGTIYPAYRISYLVCGFTDLQFPLGPDAFHRGGALLQLATILPVVLGSSVRAAEKILRAVRHRRSLIALRPLWQELVSVLPPDVIVRHFRTGTSPRDDRHQLRDLYGRLDRRVVEISDACFELLPYISEDLHHQALVQARAAGLHGAEARAAREALCLRVARTKAVDQDDYAARPARALLALGHDLQANALWLARVSRHYTSPRLADAAAALAAPQPLQGATA